MLLSLGWSAGPWTESTDQSTVLGSGCTFHCHGDLARVCGPVVPQLLSVSPPFFLHNPYQVCMIMTERHRCLISLHVAFLQCLFSSHCGGNWSYQEAVVREGAYKFADSAGITLQKRRLLYFWSNANLAGTIRLSNPFTCINVFESVRTLDNRKYCFCYAYLKELFDLLWNA